MFLELDNMHVSSNVFFCIFRSISKTLKLPSNLPTFLYSFKYPNIYDDNPNSVPHKKNCKQILRNFFSGKYSRICVLFHLFIVVQTSTRIGRIAQK